MHTLGSYQIQEEKIMKKLYKGFTVVSIFAFFATACIPPVVDVARAAPAEVTYQATLGKPVSDKTVADFIASNNCTQAGSFQLCQPAGVALWADDQQIVQIAYLYLDDSDGFAPYRGKLPLGLAANDTMKRAEDRLGQPKVQHTPQAGWEPGLPDEGSSPDHIHYWAVYRRFGVTIVYNSPSPDDKNATIHAILVNQ